MKEYLSFCEKSPTAWHAVAEIEKALKKAGFQAREESSSWKIKSGERGYITRGGSAIAYVMPKKEPKRLVIFASHTDSPALKIKPNPLFREKNMNLLRTEIYGGPLLSTWFDRNLAIAGRIVVEEKGKLKEKLIYDEKHLLTIPSLAIHLQNKEEREAHKVDKQKHLVALHSLSEKEIQFTSVVPKHLAADLYLVPTEKPCEMGKLIAGYRMDNLSSVYPSLKAAVKRTPDDDTLFMTVFWNHEEIGSHTAEGANSDLLTDILHRLLPGELYYRVKSNAVCLSIDVSHAHHPNFPDRLDPSHSPLLGGGLIIKYNANMKYATNATSAAPVIAACNKAKIAVQDFVNHNNIGTGSTVGPHVHAQGIPTIDIGLPLLAMHSTRELIATSDLKDLEKLLKVF